MNINLKNRRTRRWTIDLRWATALAFAAATFAACGSDPPENEAAAAPAAEAPGQHAALMQRAEASDRHLETLADQAEQRALYEHIDNEADARAEAAEAQARERQAQGSDQHLENLAEAGENTSSSTPLTCDSRPGHSTRPCAE